MSESFKRVVLAYSGGLDTSVILKWLQVTYGCEVVTFTADLGQGEELEPARAKAELMGIKPEHIYIDDLREEFVRDFVFPMMRANARYEGDYLLGTSIARPLISKRLVEIGNDAVEARRNAIRHPRKTNFGHDGFSAGRIHVSRGGRIVLYVYFFVLPVVVRPHERQGLFVGFPRVVQ